MFRNYLAEDLKDWEAEMKEAIKDNDTDYQEEIKEKMEEIKAKDTPYAHIIITNEVTINTLKKIVRNMYYNLDRFAENNQPLENLDNGFITPEYLKNVLSGVFNEKSNGSFPKSTKDIFGTRSRCRFVKSKLEELL